MSDVEKELATLKEEQERNRKRIEILKAKIRAEMMVLDKLLDVEDPNEIRESWERLKSYVAGESEFYPKRVGIIRYLEDLKYIKEKIATLEAMQKSAERS